ncbi:MAG TPA: epoxyqueuosine reductase QueH [Patescibacteria group bacterium]|nr:epoxyqueuosine reductase QueH [Patescibacteria group bacterium]
MKLLLHTCCAPCLIYPLERLRQEGFTATGFFYNPNIHPFGEYTSRKKAVEALSEAAGIKVSYPAYAPADFFQAVNLKEQAPARCQACWRLRLSKTASYAKEQGFDYFSTTLLVSPYQDQESLKTIGLEVAALEGVTFYCEDFRPGFRQAHEQARAQGIYCQKYCGCLYSEIERCSKSQKP